MAAARLPKSPNLICAVYNRSGGLDICEQYDEHISYLFGTQVRCVELLLLCALCSAATR